MLSCYVFRLRPRTRPGSNFRSLSCAHAERLLWINRSRALLRTIACEGIHLTSRRSLSENVITNSNFLVLRYHQPSCSRLFSTSNSSSSQTGSTSSPVSGQQATSFEEPEDWYTFPEDLETIDPAMLVLRPNVKSLPPLPPILNDALRQQIFTHRSVYSRSRHGFEDQPNDPAPDYEVLEFHGDAVLGLIITDLVQNMYPFLRVGPATKIKAMVVANVNLADISVKYGLPRNLRVGRGHLIALKASINIKADLFEAYIGGLYKDQGLDVSREWLNALFLPYVEEAYRVCRDQHGLPSPPPSPPELHAPNTELTAIKMRPVPPIERPADGQGHLSLFHQYLQQKQLVVEWTFEEVKEEGTKVTPIWAAHALVSGVELSVARAPAKKIAQNEAAREALIQLGVIDSAE